MLPDERRRRLGRTRRNLALPPERSGLTCEAGGKALRPIELLLLFLDLLMFTILAIPGLRAVHGAGYLAPITVLVAAIQVLIEGPRWQMDPAYVLAGLFCLVWWLQNHLPTGGVIGQLIANRFVTGLLIGLGVIGLVAAIGLPMALPVFHFPRPSGPYQIGTVTYDWVDTGRHELFSTDPSSRRELMVQIWYPAEENSSTVHAPYMPDAGQLSPDLARVLHLPASTFGYWKYVTTNAAPSVPVATDQASYPVLVYLSGMNGFRQSSTFQVQELVSHGYIVAAVDQPYAAAGVVFADGHQIDGWTRDQMQPLINQSLTAAEPAPIVNSQPLPDGIIPYFARDVSFTFDQLAALNRADPQGILTGRLDLQHLGIFGISLGAMVAGEAAHLDPRIKASLMMDAAMPADVVQAGLRQPSMWITRDAGSMRLERERSGGWSETDIAETLTSMRAVFGGKTVPGTGYYVQIPGMFHINFTDAPYWSPLFPRLGLTGPIDAQRGFDIVNAYSVAFFDQHLKGRPTALLDKPPEHYPEVIFERH